RFPAARSAFFKPKAADAAKKCPMACPMATLSAVTHQGLGDGEGQIAAQVATSAPKMPAAILCGSRLRRAMRTAGVISLSTSKPIMVTCSAPEASFSDDDAVSRATRRRERGRSGATLLFVSTDCD